MEHFAAAALMLAAFVTGPALMPQIVGMLGSSIEHSRHAKGWTGCTGRMSSRNTEGGRDDDRRRRRIVGAKCR
jgi:hypothetical protein